MTRISIAMALLAALAAGAAAAPSSRPANAMPEWAYAVPLKGQPALPRLHEDSRPYSLPGSKLRFTRNKVQGVSDDGKRGRVPPADWFPDEHPRMPRIVAEGDAKRKITPCAICHSPSGRGRSQNAGVAGLPAEYFIAQLHDFRNDRRRSAEPRKENARQMIDFAKAMSEQEIREAAVYYASLPWTQWEKVVETDTVPKMASADGMWLPLAGNAREPIGARLIETPTDPVRTDLRDPHTGFTSYVPKGTLGRGRWLVTTGGARKTRPCAICHGINLGGVGRVPPIAGRSPSYIARQLYDMQVGARHGSEAGRMKPVVARLDAGDILAIAAYTASIPLPSAGKMRF
jgi:cytochrome c553